MFSSENKLSPAIFEHLLLATISLSNFKLYNNMNFDIGILQIRFDKSVPLQVLSWLKTPFISFISNIHLVKGTLKPPYGLESFGIKLITTRFFSIDVSTGFICPGGIATSKLNSSEKFEYP